MALGKMPREGPAAQELIREREWLRLPKLESLVNALRESARAFLSFPGESQGRENHGLME